MTGAGRVQKSIRPPRLEPGARIGIVSPCYWMRDEPFRRAVGVFEALGYQMVPGASTRLREHRFAGTPEQRAIRAAHPDALEQLPFDAGSMGPKIRGACRFVRETGRRSAIGSLGELNDIVAGRAGTQISMDAEGIEFFKPGD